MFGFLPAPRQQCRTSESLSCDGDASGSRRHRHVPAASAVRVDYHASGDGTPGSGRHRNVPAASAVRVDDHASGSGAPGRVSVSVIEPPASEVRYRYLAWSTYLDAVGGDLRN